ncbi:MAG: CBS domain-containing protein [Planctomycetes bacterium]|nr:CBS domain-containing protein [Planctomycetota bacterium]
MAFLLAWWSLLFLAGQGLSVLEGALAAFVRFQFLGTLKDPDSPGARRWVRRRRVYSLYVRTLFVLTLLGFFLPGVVHGEAPFSAAAGAGAVSLLVSPVSFLYGRRHTGAILSRAFRPLDCWYYILWPVSRPLEWLVGFFSRPEERESADDESRKDAFLNTVEGMASVDGLLEEDSLGMIESLLEFKDAQVSEVMTPRTEMFCLEGDTPVNEAVRRAREGGHSRVPVFKETRDNVVGIFYVKDLLDYWGRAAEPRRLSEVMRTNPYFVPETKLVKHLLREFREKMVQIAVVVDEYGGTAGLVTSEDIIEVIVGDIFDEWDEKEGRLYTRVASGETHVDARMRIDEVNDLLRIRVPDDEYETVGGWLFNRLGHMPRPGESVDLGPDGAALVSPVLPAADADQREPGTPVTEQASGSPPAEREPGETFAARDPPPTVRLTVTAATDRRITRLAIHHPPVGMPVLPPAARGVERRQTARLSRQTETMARAPSPAAPLP